MGLYAELEKPFRIALPQTGRRYRVEFEANRIIKQYGFQEMDSPVREDVLAQAEQALDAGAEALRSLGMRAFMAVPFAIWRSQSRWRHRSDLVEAFLARAESDWRGAARQLWRRYLLTFDQRDSGTLALSRWLQARSEALPSKLRSFSDRFQATNPDIAPKTLAKAALTGELAGEFAEVGLGADSLRSSSLLAAILEAVGAELQQPGATLPVQAIKALMGGDPRGALENCGCSQATLIAAMGSLVTGVVSRQRRIDPRDAEPDRALEFVVAFAGDPRAADVAAKPAALRWREAVPDSVRHVVEQWLSRKTIDAFFRVIDALGKDAMWEARKAFWQQYLPWIEACWLVAGPLAEQHALKEEIPFGRFAKVPGTLPYHCGLQMELRSRSGGPSLLVMEMNANGAAMFWNRDAKDRPALYEAEVNRQAVLDMQFLPGVARRPHARSWQDRFRAAIMQDIGVSP